jgi:hypothetical protein
MKQWITNRLVWLDDHMPNRGACEDWPVDASGTLIAEVYPNPLSTANTIVIKTKINQDVYFRVTDAMGRIVHSQKINAVPLSNYITNLHTESWQKGIYIFSFANKEGEKIVKKVLK